MPSTRTSFTVDQDESISVIVLLKTNVLVLLGGQKTACSENYGSLKFVGFSSKISGFAISEIGFGGVKSYGLGLGFMWEKIWVRLIRPNRPHRFGKVGCGRMRSGALGARAQSFTTITGSVSRSDIRNDLIGRWLFLHPKKIHRL